jgi:hypothetical protein
MTNDELEDLVRRAEALYEHLWKRELERDALDMFVAIEPESQQYFLGKTMSEATALARQAHPDRMTHMMRVGHAAAIHLGTTRGWTLQELLEQVTPENRHAEVDFGRPVGKEIW